MDDVLYGPPLDIDEYNEDLNVVRSGMKWHTCDGIFPIRISSLKALKMCYKLIVDGVEITDLTTRSIPHKKVTLRLTPARRFNRVTLLDQINEIKKKLKLKDYTGFWALEALHVNISTCYRKYACAWRGEIIGYDHYFESCPFLFEWIDVWGFEDGTELWLPTFFG